jgi:hypothetical protein
MASYAGALALNFRRSVPGKPPYPGAWSLNFRAQNIYAKTLARGVARGGDRPTKLIYPN